MKQPKQKITAHSPSTANSMSNLTPPDLPPIKHWFDDYKMNPTPRWWIRTQNAVIWWIAGVVTYSVARFPLGLAIGILRNAHGNWTIASQVRIADAIIYLPFRVIGHLLSQLDHHQTLLGWIVGLYFGGYFLTWGCILGWMLFSGVNDYLRTMLDNR
jgi:hypothetical protein